MGDKYSDYLRSDAWKEKRKQRLELAKHRCAVCGVQHSLQVHHLTYARIYNEDMADLLPLCEPHHRAAEYLVKKKKITRTDNVLFLATETIRLIMEMDIPKPEPKPKSQIYNAIEVRNCIQKYLVEQEWFLRAVQFSRDRFKVMAREALKSAPGRNSKLTNAFALYDRHHRQMKIRLIGEFEASES